MTSDFSGPAGYVRDRDGIVHLTNAVLPCGDVPELIFTLPPGYRPEYVQFQTGWARLSEPVRVDITPAGVVRIETTPFSGLLTLGQISFRCGPSGQDGCP